MQERRKLPALDNAAKLNSPDLNNIGDRNYTDTILRYGGLAIKYSQLLTNAKTIVAAINELYTGGGGGDGKHRTLTQAEYDALPEEEKNNGTIYFIEDMTPVVLRPEDLRSSNAYQGQLLWYNNGLWEPTYGVSNLQDGDVLKYNATQHTWVNGESSAVGSLNDLTDVDISDAEDGQILQYDAQEDKWRNEDFIKVSLDSPQDGQILRYYSTWEEWSNVDNVLYNLQDISSNVEYPYDGDVLRYDSSAGVWTNYQLGLSSLSDVNDYLSPNTDEVLMYDGYQWTSSYLYLGSLVDVSSDVESPSEGQVLMYNGYEWTAGDITSSGYLYQLQDVSSNVEYPSTNDVLMYDGYEWTAYQLYLNTLGDVSDSSPSSGDVLKYDGSEWYPTTLSFYDLSDINTYTEPYDGDILKYDGSENLWGPASLYLYNIADVDSENATGGQILVFDDYDYVWVPADNTLDNLQNVTISSPSDGQVLKYNATDDVWENATGGGGGASDLSDLDDVSISSPTSGQVLKYNNGTWENANESTGSTVSVTQVQSTGTKIATITVDSVGTDLYAPQGGGAVALDDLTDVSITSATDGQVLTYDSNSGEWVNDSLPSIPEDITDLSDVSVTSVSNGQVLKYNNGTWENANESTGSTVSVTQIQSTGTKIATITVDSIGTDLYAPNGGGGAAALDDLTDVDIDTTTLANRDELIYNSSTSQWENKQVTVTLTQAQYDALVIAGTVDPDVFYLITDASIVPWTDLTSTLTAGSTSITFSNAIITANSTIDVYTDSDIDYNSITVTTGQVVITFDAQASNVSVKVRVS